jgi:hypothetical protein
MFSKDILPNRTAQSNSTIVSISQARLYLLDKNVVQKIVNMFFVGIIYTEL